MIPAPLLPDRPRPLVFAHRGCSSLAPENTLAAFNMAREVNAPGIELDVHLCASGELVVAHDDTFTRTAGDSRAVADLTFKEIRAMDVGSFFDPCFKGENPPLLEEILEEFCPGLYVDIELKTRKIKGDPLPDLAAEKIIALGDRVLRSVSVSSFNPFSLIAFKKACPLIPTALIWSADKEVPAILRRGLGRFIAPCDYLKPVYVQAKGISHGGRSRLRKRPIVPWTIDDPVLAEQMLRLGCEGLITNRPQDMARIIAYP
ncbi:MAG: glycerophosphodiester phosphodiesterase [Treponema sp.]|jgi:glycerophosphoryl diester phosphodiesterase|nr:glycerophosphodiester phosphodiesterase [Treponema sp.]